MTTKDDDPNEATIQSSFESVASGLMEVIIDQTITTEGILKDIPIASTVIGLLSSVRAFKDQMLEKKIESFLLETKNISSEEARLVIDKIESDNSYKIKVGEKLLYIIDRSEDHEAASLVGRLFVALINGKLNHEEFIKAAMIVNRLSNFDLERFLAKSQNSIDLGDLTFSGLYRIIAGSNKLSHPISKSGRVIGAGEEMQMIETELAVKIRHILS